MTGGYAMINGKGIELSNKAYQELYVKGIYEKAQAAVNTGKPIQLWNVTWDNGDKFSPMPVYHTDLEDPGEIQLISKSHWFTITAADAVIVEEK